jgi:signal transduction histidine kinase
VLQRLVQWRPVVVEDQLFCIYRDGRAEETYLTACCSRLPDEHGGGGGVLISIDETTERVRSARRTAALLDVADAALGARSVREGCARSLAAMSRHASDIPFALLYLCDPPGGRVHLAGTAHLQPGAAASPPTIVLDVAGSPPTWPVASVMTANAITVVSEVVERFGALPAGDWPFAPRCAVVVPVTAPGCAAPAGALVAGVSARHAADAEYRDFIALIAKQIGAAIAGGRVHEEAGRQADMQAMARRQRARRRARLRALKARFAGVLEERTRLAREIHDTLLQGVTGIALQLRAALLRAQRADAAPTTVETLERLLEIAETTSREARQAVWDIRPSELANADFMRAVEIAARRLIDRSGARFSVSVVGRRRRLTREQQDVVLRVVQEAVANAVRHGEAAIVRLTFTYESEAMTATVADDGHGFVVQPSPHAYVGHWGLVGMQERARSVDAEFSVHSEPGAGATVRLVLPYGRRAKRGVRGSTASAARRSE